MALFLLSLLVRRCVRKPYTERIISNVCHKHAHYRNRLPHTSQDAQSLESHAALSESEDCSDPTDSEPRRESMMMAGSADSTSGAGAETGRGSSARSSGRLERLERLGGLGRGSSG